jgi:hypothetical protein
VPAAGGIQGDLPDGAASLQSAAAPPRKYKGVVLKSRGIGMRSSGILLPAKRKL